MREDVVSSEKKVTAKLRRAEGENFYELEVH